MSPIIIAVEVWYVPPSEAERADPKSPGYFGCWRYNVLQAATVAGARNEPRLVATVVDAAVPSDDLIPYGPRTLPWVVLAAVPEVQAIKHGHGWQMTVIFQSDTAPVVFNFRRGV